MRIKCIKIQQGEVDFYIGAMKVKDLIKLGRVDMFGVDKPSGYQRLLSTTRARAFGRFIDSGGFSPASILMNVRKGKITENDDGTLDVEDKTKLWIVDGQHRIAGVKIAVERNPDLNELEFPIIIMNQLSDYEEAKQFVIINKTHKGVRTDLAERFLMNAVKLEGREKLMSMREAGVLKGILKNVEWITKAIQIADILNEDGKHPWYRKIRLPNEPKDGTTVAQKAFTDSLEPILKNEFFQGKDVGPIASAIGNYWDAICELCEDAFEEPRDYVIQKTTGVFVLNRIFTRVSEFCRDEKGNRVLTRQKIKSVLQGLPFMTSDYWKNNGIAGQRGTNKKAFAMLVMEALEALEKKQEHEQPDLVI